MSGGYLSGGICPVGICPVGICPDTVRTIVNNWTSAGLLVSRAKDAINVEDLVPDLVKICQYRTLAANVEFLEGSAYTITEAYGLLKNMQFDHDPCAIKNYIKNDYPTLI